MNKEKVDEITLDYQSKIFGFAMSKTREISEAEELAADIVCELYKSLLKADIVANVDGYVYRISKNVYARYVDKKDKNKYLDIQYINCSYVEPGFNDIEDEEVYQNIRRNIGLLSQRQRAIIYMKYYKNMSVESISKELNISSGTVKWHLSDARNSLKEKMTMKREDNLSVNPIKFVSMGHSGSPGTSGDTKDMFDTRLKQNIAWCCYHEAKNLEQIAKELGVPVAYVEGELSKLVEWGYIDQVDDSKKPKYLTNMYITDDRINVDNIIELNKEVAMYLCDKVFENAFEEFDNSKDNWGFECPENDKNFVKYNLVMLIIKCMSNNVWEGWDDFAVKRPDGGHFISYATVTDDCTKTQVIPYNGCGYMHRDVYRNDKLVLQSLQYNCMYCDREIDWRTNESRDWEDLYDYIQNGCDKEKINMESYCNLCEKGYVADDKVQVLIFDKDKKNPEQDMYEIIKNYVPVTDEIADQGKLFDSKYYEMNKEEHPRHIEPLVKYHNVDTLSWQGLIPYVVEELLKRGTLLPLSDTQKKAVFSAVCI